MENFVNLEKNKDVFERFEISINLKYHENYLENIHARVCTACFSACTWSR